MRSLLFISPAVLSSLNIQDKLSSIFAYPHFKRALICQPLRKKANGLHALFSEQAGFTLVEVLAAMLFMAIVIPAVIHGLTVANRLEVLTSRKKEAALLASNLLTEKTITGEWRYGTQEGEASIGPRNYLWTMQAESWNEDPSMLQVILQVQFSVQGRNYGFSMSTLVDGETQ